MAYPTNGERAVKFMTEVVEALTKDGIPVPVISGGGTPALLTLREFPLATEHRAGTYVYNDVMMVRSGAATWDDCAMRVRTTVVSTPTPDRAIVDAGSKALTREQHYVKGFGRVVEYPDATVANLSEEHGIIDTSRLAEKPKVGDVVNVWRCLLDDRRPPVGNVRGAFVRLRSAGDTRTAIARSIARGRRIETSRPDGPAVIKAKGENAMDWKLELVAVPVSDVDRAKAFYVDKAGFNADHDHRVSDEIRFVQLTPRGSACSIALGKGITQAAPGSVEGLQLVVSDVAAARKELAGRGVEVSEVQEFPWGRFVFFSDPDGNKWAVQEIQART